MVYGREIKLSLSKHALGIFLLVVWLILPTFIYFIGHFALYYDLDDPNFMSGDVDQILLNTSEVVVNPSVLTGVEMYAVGIQNIPSWIYALFITPLVGMTIYFVAVYIRGD